MKSAIFLMLCSGMLAGCACLDQSQSKKQEQSENLTPEQLIASVKDEVNYLQQYLLAHPISFTTKDNKPLCTANKPNEKTDATKLKPITRPDGKAIITFTVSHELDSSVKVGPGNSVIALDASYSRKKSDGRKQTIEYDFSTDEPTPKTFSNADLAKLDSELVKHPVANTAYSALLALSNASHKPPCLLDGNVAVTVNFTAQKTTDTGAEVGVVLKVGGDKIESSEFDQSLELDFPIGVTAVE